MRTTFVVGRVSRQCTHLTVTAGRKELPLHVVKHDRPVRTFPPAVVPALRAAAIH